MARNTIAFVIAIIVALGLTMHTPEAASASPFTPLEWQREVTQHADPAFQGQRKHLTWNRDQDRNFIDDEIQARYRPGDKVNVIVDLNTCLRGQDIRRLLSRFGRITYIGKLITLVLLDGVRVEELSTLALVPQVAMIEWQAPVKAMIDVSSRAIQSRRSNTYLNQSAQDVDLPLCPTPAGCTGQGVGIAIVDTGVDSTHEAFTGKFVWGYDATTTTDLMDIPTKNDADGHGTHVAGIALGNPTADAQGKCRNPSDGSSLTDYCGGVATGAGLIDVKVCRDADHCDWPAIFRGLEWLAANATTKNIRVANISLAAVPDSTGFCPDDNGTSAWPQEVNKLVALGIVVVTAHGNAGNCGFVGFAPGHYPRLTPAPGSASSAITVQATNDKETIDRSNDTRFDDTLLGPRNDVDLTTGLPMEGLKPDLSAPGVNINSAKAAQAGGTGHDYVNKDGTSMATAHVAGASAVLLQARPNINPSSLKALFKQTADSTRNGSDLLSPDPYPTVNSGLKFPPFPMVDPVWAPDFGSGIVNVFDALAQATSDVGFSNCSLGPPATPTGLCELIDMQPPWMNSSDISTAGLQPQVGIPTTIRAKIENRGLKTATVSVKFSVYEFAAGNFQFYSVGTRQVSIAAGDKITVSHPWTPAGSNHNCIQVSIDYGLDSNFNNNLTQLNLLVAPSPPATLAGLRRSPEVRIENPFMVPAVMELRPKSNREGWICRVSEESFVLDPFEDCPRKVRVIFNAPPKARPGERANCDIAVYATPQGARTGQTPILIGGVSVQTFVPKRIPTKTGFAR